MCANPANKQVHLFIAKSIFADHSKFVTCYIKNQMISPLLAQVW